MKRILALFLALSMGFLSSGSVRGDGIEKWFYAYVDLLLDPVRATDETSYTAAELIAMFPPLKAQGYSVIVLSSYQLGSKAQMDPESARDDAKLVQASLAKIVAAAKCHGIEIIPEVMPVGASESILQNNFHLAEGTPVRNLKLKLTADGDSILLGQPDHQNLLKQGDFSGSRPELEAAWEIGSGFSAAVNARPLGTDGKSQSLELDLAAASDIQIGQGFAINPNQQYRLSFRFKTEGVRPSANHLVDFYARMSGSLDGKDWVSLERMNYEVRDSQDWTRYEVLLNSYHCTHGSFWFGFNRGNAGKAWIADVELKLACGANLLQRPDLDSTVGMDESLPVIVINTTTKKRLESGMDFMEWKDAAVEKTGFRHTRQDTPIRFFANRVGLQDEIEVCYHHASLPVANEGNVCCSLRHPEVLELFQNQIVQIQAVVKPKRWLINHDEIRGMGHDPLSKGDSPAVMLKENLSKCIEIIKAVTPNPGIIVFNDMYDPEHNAVQRDARDKSNHRLSYYPMVNGDFHGSGNGMDRSVTILNWQTASKAMTSDDDIQSWQRSLNYFGGLGTKQVISGFYDVIPGEGNAAQFVRDRTRKIFETAVCNGLQPVAVCYYSTRRNHAFTKEFAETADDVLGRP